MSNDITDKLVRVDLGAYAGRLHKFYLFQDHYMENALKFLHFNVGTEGQDQKTFGKRMFRIWQNRTIAVLALSPNAIKKIAADYLANPEPMTVAMAVGVAYVSKDDNYNKAIGRDQSVRNIKELDLEIKNVEINENHIFIALVPHEGVQLRLRLNRKTGFSTVTGHITGSEKDRK